MREIQAQGSVGSILMLPALITDPCEEQIVQGRLTGTEGSLPTLHAQARFHHCTYSRGEWRRGCSHVSLPGISHAAKRVLSPEQVDSDRDPGDPTILGFRESLASWVSANRECDSLQDVPFVTHVT